MAPEASQPTREVMMTGGLVRSDPTERARAAEAERIKEIIEHLNCALANCHKILAELEGTPVALVWVSDQGERRH